MWKKIPWQDVCKFLSGAFFVSAGVLFYLYAYRIPVPIFSTGFIESPELSGLRAVANSLFFLLCFYLGFIRKWKSGAIA